MQFWLSKLFPQVRPNERSRFVFFLLLSALLSLAQTMGLVLSESLLLGKHGPGSLPLSFILAAVATMVGSLLYALGVRQAKNDRYFIHLLAAMAMVIVLLWVGVLRDSPGVYYALVCVFFVSQCIVQNHYWTFTGDFFDTLAAKRLFPLFVVGNSLGGVLGALLLAASGHWLQPSGQLLLWPLFLLASLGLIRLYRRPLRRWGPLELEEADETSLMEMRNAANYLRQSPLGKQLVVSCACMILAAFVGQYLYSSVFLTHYPDPEQLATFLATLLACTNGLEILVELLVTPWLIARLGVANANQVHSGLTVASFVGLIAYPGLVTAILLRLTRESLDNAVASPIRSLVYNALPARSRGRVRAFLEGLVTYAAMALAGVVLALVGTDGTVPDWMYWLGLVAALLYLLMNFRVRTSYLATMITEVEAGRLDLDELSAGFTGSEVARFQDLWAQLSREAGLDPDPALSRLAQTLAHHGVWEPLTTVAGNPNAPPWLRRICLQALSQGSWNRDWRLLESCANDAQAEVRLAALQAVGDLKPGLVPSWLLSKLDDPVAEVRSLASSLLLTLPRGPERERGFNCFLELLSSEEPATVVAGLQRAPLALQDRVLPRCDHPQAVVARRALLRLAELRSDEDELRRSWVEAAQRELQRPEPEVRAAALQLLYAHADLLPAEAAVWQRLATHLGEPYKQVRDRAQALLTQCPLDLGPVLGPYLESPSWITARAAVQCVTDAGQRDLLQNLLRQLVKQLWVYTLVLRTPVALDTLSGRYWNLCLENARDRTRKLIFDVLAGLENQKLIRSVEKVLRFSNLRARADALEVLSNLGDREAAQMLVLLLETGDLEHKLSSLSGSLVRASEWSAFSTSPALLSDTWLKEASAWVRGEQPLSGEQEERVERLVVLRKVPLFAQMNLEQLAAIDQRLEEVQYLAGEAVFHEGDLGAELYILLDGSVRVVKGAGSPQELLLTRLEGVNYFGDMSILDDEPRSASVIVERNSRLLVLKGEQLKDLVEQMPEMAFEIIKVLTARIRQSDDRLHQMVKSKGS